MRRSGSQGARLGAEASLTSPRSLDVRPFPSSFKPAQPNPSPREHRARPALFCMSSLLLKSQLSSQIRREVPEFPDRTRREAQSTQIQARTFLAICTRQDGQHAGWVVGQSLFPFLSRSGSGCSVPWRPPQEELTFHHSPFGPEEGASSPL